MEDMRMKLSKINISGYKSYGAVYSEDIMLRDVNIIIGANGAGKSNFISFLELIAYIASGGLDKFVAKNGFSNSLLHFGETGEEKIKGQVDFIVDDKKDSYSFVLSSSVGGKLYFERESILYQNNEKADPYRREFGVSTSGSGLVEFAETDNTAKTILKLLKGCRIFHFNDTSINSSMRSQAYLHDNLYLRSDAGNIASFLYRMKDEKKPYYDRIVNVVREVFPRFEDFVLEPTSLNDTNSYVLLNWKEFDSDEIFGPHMLSDGTIRFIALATLLLQPENLLPGVIILDEPEMGLHPFAIKTLADLIYQISDKAQIIAATQSVELLNHFESEDVLIAEYDNKRRSSFLRAVDSEKLGIWLEEYTLGDLWDKNVLGGVP